MESALGGEVALHVPDQLQEAVDLAVFGLLFVVDAAVLVADPQLHEEGLGTRKDPSLGLVVAADGDLLGGIVPAVQSFVDGGGTQQGLFPSLGAAQLAVPCRGHEVDLVKIPH